MNNKNPISLFLIFLFIYPILKGFIKKYNTKDIKWELSEFEKSVSALLALIFGFLVFKNYFLVRENGIFTYIPQKVILVLDAYPWLLYVIVLPILGLFFYQIFHLTFLLVNSIILFPLLDIVERFLKNRSILFKRITGAIAELPKSMCNVVFFIFILNFASILNISPKLNTLLEESNIYTNLCKQIVIPVTNSKLAKALPNIVDNSFKVKIQDDNGIGTWEDIKKYKNISLNKNKQIVYYNGITLEEGIRSNEEINNYAKHITAGQNTDRAKARTLYAWIGSNINYDDDKAQQILNNDFSSKSGSIITFNTKKGICFDYACLYVSMSKAVGLKVRMVTGEGYNGISWVSHAWNQVYLEDEDKWINVDPTFYKGGNYFNSRRFELDHKNPKIIGEW
ncbi:Transglutaminase-like superfamily protein [Clostridium amylolyticum]|uniref:Transglutaminase-like superfamily protein n=1 Tax=Clostridium amylolyticum TaxID=1121298 RepID=A0A1M6KRE8_9CLOT|nr:transglutaminase domain-containing protein [Clostridium amylolyticum]SHJ61464.1 Transglutaminase-like superfamily protein [Clostridium amylolyticum]